MIKKRLYTNTCNVCHKTFNPHNRAQKYCSQECFNQVRSQHRKKRTTLTCVVCGSLFEVKEYRAKTSRYCSKDCWGKRSPIREKSCAFCSTTFTTYDDNQQFCTQSCAGKSRTGKSANAYKNGKSSQTKRGQLKGGLTHWRKSIYKRDNYTCQKCGAIGVEFHAHHIKEFADFPDLALDINNGITVCIPCHEEIHGRKISSPSKYPKNCVDCGIAIPGKKSAMCRSCSIANSWRTKRNAVTSKTCPVCNTIFKKRREQIFCSLSCKMKHHHSLNKTGSTPV